MGQYSEKNNIVISDVPLPEDSGMSLIGYLYQAGINDGLTSIEMLAEAQTEAYEDLLMDPDALDF